LARHTEKLRTKDPRRAALGIPRKAGPVASDASPVICLRSCHSSNHWAQEAWRRLPRAWPLSITGDLMPAVSWYRDSVL